MNRANGADFTAWQGRIGELLSGNRFALRGHRYTAPSLKVPLEYEEQFLWDSCFHALAWRWIEPAMAKDELLAVVSAQHPDGPDAGMIPHMTYWHREAAPLWGRSGSSSITQPPLVAYAALKVYQQEPSQAMLETIYASVSRHHGWLDRRRDPDQDHLVALIHPWESGWDASPRWDRPMHLHQPSYEEAKAARFALAQTLGRYTGNALELAQDGYFYVETAEFNAIRAADLEALARIAELLHEPAEARFWQEKARRVQQAVRDKLLARGAYALSGLDEEPLPGESAADFITLFGGCPSPEQAAQLVSRLQEPRYWTAYPVPTSPADDPHFEPNTYWRGNVWPSVNYLIYRGLRRYGYTPLASELAGRNLALVEQSGFYEFFNPLDGRGLGAHPQSWTGVVLDLLATELGLESEME